MSKIFNQPQITDAAGRYPVIGMKTSYLVDMGTFPLPVAARVSGGGKKRCKRIRTHAPIGFKTVEWTVTRLSEMPDIPHPLSPGLTREKAVLERMTIAPHTVNHTAGGDAVFNISGVYEYSLDEPIGPGDPLRFGRPPDTNIPADLCFVPASSFKTNIL